MAESPDLSAVEGWKSLVATFDDPAGYSIRVEGHLSADWSARLGGLCITATDVGGAPVTELSGELRDQAALHGVLSTLYGLGLPLLAVVRLPEAHQVPAGPAGGARAGAEASRPAGPAPSRRAARRRPVDDRHGSLVEHGADDRATTEPVGTRPPATAPEWSEGS